ncbi:MAG: hypothetical protein D6768_01830 [Chloroflexi bacterium]|nr:MAG: hypothetical protein D6768_01830 [Chloroflexota bacterium]
MMTGLFGGKNTEIQTTEEYRAWRAQAFTVAPEQVGVSGSDAGRVFGVIMDIGLVDRPSSTHWAISLNAFPTGEAAYHPTPGGSATGLGSIPEAAQMARQIVQNAQALLPQTNETQDFSLPEPGFVQFFFLTPGGVRVFRNQLDNLQKPGNDFSQLLDQFGFIRRVADQLLDKNRNFKIKGLYVLALTALQMDQATLMGFTRMAADRLQAKDPVFKQRMEQWRQSRTRIEIAGAPHVAGYTLAHMQGIMTNWLKQKFSITLNPTPGTDFFVNGMRDRQGKENIVLYYFDLAPVAE